MKGIFCYRSIELSIFYAQVSIDLTRTQKNKTANGSQGRLKLLSIKKSNKQATKQRKRTEFGVQCKRNGGNEVLS